MTWDDYNHSCDACFRNYNQSPRQEPCWSHKNKPEPPAETAIWVEPRMVFGADWKADDKPYDFSLEPRLLERLRFQRWLYCRDNTL